LQQVLQRTAHPQLLQKQQHLPAQLLLLLVLHPIALLAMVLLLVVMCCWEV
jgi:hypothetical protein